MKIIIALCLAVGLLAIGIPLSRAISDEEAAADANAHHARPAAHADADGQAAKAGAASH